MTAEALQLEQDIDDRYEPFGDGRAAEKIVEAIEQCIIDRL